MPDVTILMAVHNGMPELPEAVESIRRQTLRDWKFVIVDDASTDEGPAYLATLDDPRIEVVRGPKEGLGLALNRGLEACHTEFVARMDADDIAHPTRLEEQLAFLRRNPEVGLVGTQVERLGEVRAAGRSLLPCDHDAICSHLIKGRPAMYHSTIMCRTSLLKEIGGYWQTLGEDWDMLLRMAERTKLANVDRVLLSFRFRGNSITGKAMADALSHVAYACELSRRRRSGASAIDYEEFLLERRRAPFWRRAMVAMEVHARCQYRTAVVDMLGRRRLRGYLRLGWAALCAPWMMQARVLRVVRHWLRLPSLRGKTHSKAAADASSPLKKGTGSEPTSENLAKNNGREVPVPLFQQAAKAFDATASESLVKTPVTIVAPCHNEEAALPMLFDRLTSLAQSLADRYRLEFVIVDDNSTDNTLAVLQRQSERLPGCRVLTRDGNRGVAAAIMAGIREARTEIVCSIDADCSYDPLQLGRMIAMLGPDVGLVTASPYHRDGRVSNIPAWRLALSKAASLLYRFALRSRLSCYTSCFRVYRASAVRDIELHNAGFVGIAELVWRLDQRGVQVVECPAVLDVRRHGSSKMRTAKVMVRHFKLLGRVFWERALCIPHASREAEPFSHPRVEREECISGVHSVSHTTVSERVLP